MRYFEERSFGEIAATLDVTEGAAHKRVERALEKLRERLARRGVASTAAALSLSLERPLAVAAPPAGLLASVTGAATALGVSALAGWSLVAIMNTKAAASAAAVATRVAGGFATKHSGRHYLPLLQRLNFSPAHIERFKEILGASTARGSDVGAAARAQWLEFSDPVNKKLWDESEAQRKRELVELFSSAGYGEFEAFERALPLRGFVDGLAVEVAAKSPLSAQQGDRLVQILTDAKERYRRGERGDP